MSEIMNIPLGGVSNEPNDYSSEDGALSLSLNAVKHHGSIRPVMPGSPVKDIGELPANTDVVAIHEVGSMKHYILLERPEDVAGSRPEERHTVCFYNMPGGVRIWWKPYPEDFSYSRSTSFQVTLGHGDYAYTTALTPNVPEYVAGKALCVGMEGSTPVLYDYANGKVLASDDISAVWRDMYDNTQTVANLKVEEVGPQDYEPPTNPYDDTDGDHRLLYIDAGSESKNPVELAYVAGDVSAVRTIGNVLTVARKGKALTYFIWKDGGYIKLGTRLPLLKASPYLRSTVASSDSQGTMFEGKWNFDESLVPLNGASYQSALKSFFEDKQSVVFTEEQRKDLSDRIFAAINSAHRSLSEEGYFYAPFFVRFSLRMYDGSHVMHTPPILMIAGAAGKPITGVRRVRGDDKYYYYQQLVFCASRLCADIDIERLEQWEDLVTHVDVFVSAPIVDYSDGADALKGIGLANIPYSNENGPVANTSLLPEYNPLYMKDKKETGNLYEDYLAQTENPFYRSGTQILCGYHKRLDSGLPWQMLMLVRNGDEYTVTINGEEATLAPVTGDEVIGNIDGTDYHLSKVGIRDLAEYCYIKTDDKGGLSELRITSKSGTAIMADVIFVGMYTRVRDTDIYAMFQIENTTENGYNEGIISNNTFYLVKSIPVDEVKDGWRGDLYVPRNVLPSLTTREHLDDGGQMRTGVKLQNPPFTYNNRLSQVIQSRTLPASSKIADFCIGQDDRHNWYVERAWVKAQVNGQTIYCQLEAGTDQSEVNADDVVYFFYPDHNATHLILQVFAHNDIESPFQVHVHSLKKHSLLNGAYLWNEYGAVPPSRRASYKTRQEMESDADIQTAVNGNTEAAYGNMVRVSGVGNPFYFNEVNQVQLPSGKISGLSTTAKALSQGQFGAFPLYCFSDNGIWALEVSDTGTYSAKQPVSRAVCTNPESITQTEGQVLFVTKRGLMALDGSSVTCLSEILSGHNYTSALSKLDKVKELAGLKDVPNPDTHIEEWLQDARLLYDDKRQMIYAFSEEDVLGYVYSISDQAWGMMVHDLAHPLPCYTDALAVTREDGNGKRRLVNMSDHTMCGDAPKALLVTRPLAMGSADAHKTLEAVAVRGVLDKDDARLVIWASNDLKKWAIVGTSTTSWYRGKSGTPYKYYRIGLLLDWEEEDSVSGISADITTRLTNRMR
jgi:hypothetical protein